MDFRDIALADVPALASFAPAEWQVRLDTVLIRHLGCSYFHARVAVDANGIAAVGHGIVTGETGWIGNVIVRPDVRGQGLGTDITRRISDVLRREGCSSLLLIATPLGRPVYEKLGFRGAGEYVFLSVPRLQPKVDSAIRRIRPDDVGEILSLDSSATGEHRRDLLAPYLLAGWAYAPDRTVRGFFLPDCGGGLVIAYDEDAGLALLAFKHSMYGGGTVVPDGNDSALRFLLAHGAAETMRAPRMLLGSQVAWQPRCVFARGTGYFG